MRPDVRIAIVVSLWLAAGASLVAAADDTAGACSASARSWAEQCGSHGGAAVVPVTCLPGRLVIDVALPGASPLRVDINRAAAGGLVRAGGAAIAPVGDFPNWTTEPPAHHAAIDLVAACVARDSTVLEAAALPAADRRVVAAGAPGTAHEGGRAPYRALVAWLVAAAVLGAVILVGARRLPLAIGPPPSPPRAGSLETASRHWELFVATAMVILVVGGIDATALRDPRLLFSLAPLVILVGASLVPMTLRRTAGWFGAFLVLAVATGDARYAGLAYPALALAGALVARDLTVRRR